MTLNLGILGFGRIGAEHAGWVSASDGIRVAKVADPTEARRTRARNAGFRTCSQLDELLEDASIDAVLIATPSAMHFEHAEKAIRAGKHVMVEKPMAMDLAQAQAMVETARAQKKILSVFHNRRWDIDYLTVKDAIASGRFGKIINIESRIHQWASCVGPAAREYHPNWRNEAAFGGGGLYDWGSHLVDQIWQLMLPAAPVSVFAQLRGNVWSSDCDDFARVCINFDNGAVGMVEINTTTTRPLPRWQIDGALGSAQAPQSPTYDTREWAQLQFRPADGNEMLLPMANDGLTESDIWTRFALAIYEGSPPAVPVQTVLPTMALIDAARRSSESCQAIEVRELVRRSF
jgi:predicted dehydrogenase